MGEQIMVEHTIVYHIRPQVINPKVSSAKTFLIRFVNPEKLLVLVVAIPRRKKGLQELKRKPFCHGTNMRLWIWFVSISLFSKQQVVYFLVMG